ncbi:Chemotaxis phosphatase CheX [Trichlorobacter thiogenes]|uniref:Chemotaxis phosphatase CheX n=1 Tax=Trichlorobacter thiogenes TaxID=115783 RepID=A0A1T4MSY3_9BACT|nr:chemotaxis protein CheX [Trichlorobacter thiogenes]SJZ69778.1 Chemotaxis phosphatase CheX [Trichlorobacter thiogenes]
MAVKFFGQFLVEQDAVTGESLLHAIELQERTNLKLGEMAVAMGFITQQDIETAHSAQLSKDMKLGDLLVDLGFLSPTQLDEVISHQKATHLYIGEALVKVGALTPEKLEQYLEAFKADQAPYVANRVELPAWLSENAAAWEMTVDLTYKMITRVLGMQFRAGKFTETDTLSCNHMIAAMDLSGDLTARYLLSVSAGIQKTIAKAILKEDDVENEDDEILEDTVMEFVNIVCGNVVAKASQMGVTLDINPPVTLHPSASGLAVPTHYRCVVFPIHVGDNETMEMALFIKQ